MSLIGRLIAYLNPQGPVPAPQAGRPTKGDWYRVRRELTISATTISHPELPHTYHVASPSDVPAVLQVIRGDYLLMSSGRRWLAAPE